MNPPPQILSPDPRRRSPDNRHVLIAVNPTAGARSQQDLVTALSRHLKRDGLTVDRVTELENLDAAMTRPARDRIRAVVAAGGDGTVAAVVNRVPAEVPLAILPLGTENLLAKYLQRSADPALLSDQIRQGWSIRIDAGQAGDRVFLLMVGIGFDADVVQRLHNRRRGHIQHLSYFKPIFDSIRSYQYPPFRLYCKLAEADRREPQRGYGAPASSITARWAFVVNLPRYAAGLQFVPEAVGTDGLLDVCTFQRGSLFSGLRYLARLLCDRHRRLPDVDVWQTTALRIESDDPVPYQLDGDPGGMLPVDITLLPQRVRLIVEKSWAEQNGFSLEPPRTD